MEKSLEIENQLFNGTMPLNFNDYQLVKDRTRFNTELIRGNKYEAVLAENIVQNISQNVDTQTSKPTHSKPFSIHPRS